MTSDGELWQLGEPSADGLARLAAELGVRANLRVEVRRLAGGRQAATHAVHFPGKGWVVLKRWDFQRVAGAEGEFARLQVAQRTGLPVPQPLAFDPAGSWFGAPALALSYIDGDLLVHPEPASWLDELAATLAKVHNTEVAGHEGVLSSDHAGLDWTPVPPPLLPRTPRVQRLLVAVQELQEDSRKTKVPMVLLHHDYRQNNILWSQGRIAGVLDWHDARLGPAASDVAYASVDLVKTNGLRAASRMISAYENIREPVHDLARWQALWLASQLPWMHRWTPLPVPGRATLTRDVVSRRLRRLADSILAEL